MHRWCPSYGLRTPSHTHRVAYEVPNILPFFRRRCSAISPTSTAKATASSTLSTLFVNEETKVQRITLEFCAVPPATLCVRLTAPSVVHGPGSRLLPFGTESTPIGFVLPLILAVWETT